MPMEMKQFARPAHCWPAARAGIHSPAEVSPMSQPMRWCGASQVPAKPTRMAATPDDLEGDVHEQLRVGRFEWWF